MEIGMGIPKICIPITGETREEIFLDIEEIQRQKPDLAEWRADCYEEGEKVEKVLEMLRTINDRLGQIPLLFTFRTAGEGGCREILFENYVKLLNAAAETGLVQLTDVEIFFREESSGELVKQLQEKGVKVVASNHHFEGTPPKEALFESLDRMYDSGADILKMAVMPGQFKDLLSLLEVTREAADKYDRPLITMSMSGTGVVSSICGEIFGSAVTFGTAGRASAPGQVDADRLRESLLLLHESL